MKKPILFIFLFLQGMLLSQNVVRYGTYAMENPKKQYKIDLGYDNEPALTDVLIGSQSDDALYTKSTIIFRRYEFYVFLDYLNFLLEKKKEWDKINISNNITDVTKNIDWYNKNLVAGCVYDNGPVITKTPLYAIYSFIKGGSGIQISTTRSSEVDSSYIFFPSSKSLEDFINKLNFQNLESYIKADYAKKNLLK